MLKKAVLTGCLVISSAALGQDVDPATLAHASNLCELHRHRDVKPPANSAQIAAAPWVYDKGFEKCEDVVRQYEAAKRAHELDIVNGVARGNR